MFSRWKEADLVTGLMSDRSERVLLGEERWSDYELCFAAVDLKWVGAHADLYFLKSDDSGLVREQSGWCRAEIQQCDDYDDDNDHYDDDDYYVNYDEDLTLMAE